MERERISQSVTVESLLQERKGQVLVKWLGWDEPTWEPIETIKEDVPELWKAFKTKS